MRTAAVVVLILAGLAAWVLLVARLHWTMTP